MDGENVWMASGRKVRTKRLFNNAEMSDVRFLVNGQTLYGHKVILGLDSPVFKSMFFCELKEQRDVIEVQDLTSVGFKNALRYIYSFEIDFELSELYESYMAADKYLVHEFHKDFFEYIKSKLSAENSCLIYDQLIKIGEREQLTLAHVRSTIIESSKATFESENFTRIDQETLISLLSLDKLSIDEFDLFVAVSKWVDCEVQRQDLPVNEENRRRVFEPIKGYIVFTVFGPEKIANREELAQLLTDEERGSLVLHWFNTSMPLKTEPKTSRNAEASGCGVLIRRSGLVKYSYLRSISRTMYLSANRSVDIQAFHTVYSGSAANLSLTIRNSNGVDLGFKPESSLKDGKWCFSFDPPFRTQPDCLYTLEITGDEQLVKEDLLSKRATFDIRKFSLVFNMARIPIIRIILVIIY